MTAKTQKILVTGAAGYIADQVLPTFRVEYDLLLVDVSRENRRGKRVEGVEIADLIDSDRTGYAKYFDGVDAVVHLGYKRRTGEHLDHFFDEMQNVQMAYNVLRSAYDAGVPRVVMASSNHAADWYEHDLVHRRKMEVLDPFALPLSDNFYGWAKAAYEHMGFLFACGASGFQTSSGKETHVSGLAGGRKMGVVNVRIGAPRELEPAKYAGDPTAYKRDLGAYISPRDMAQLFVRSIEAPDIENEHGIPWQVVYGISDNARAFWSLTNAREVLDYRPEDDSEVKFAADIQRFLMGENAAGAAGRVGPA